ncbi:protein of unknown function [Paraburkholderia kururiensis]
MGRQIVLCIVPLWSRSAFDTRIHMLVRFNASVRHGGIQRY